MQWVERTCLYKRVRFFLSVQSLRGWPVICVTFWINAYSLIKPFSFSSTFVERLSELAENFVFNDICITHDK